MFDLSFRLCSRCKKMANHPHASLVMVQIENRIYGQVCSDCQGHISKKVEEMMNEFPIPEVLQPYLIKPKPKVSELPEDCTCGMDPHAEGCLHINYGAR